MNHKHVKISKQKGLTLVELLIAAVLGLLIVGIVGSMYVTSVGGFRSSRELSRVQENTRFAFHFLQQSFRQAGYSQCGNSLTQDYSLLTDNNNSSFNGGVIGWEFNGTDVGETYDLSANLGVGVATDWGSQAGAPTLAEFIAEVANAPLKGSDIIAVTLEQERNDIAVDGTTSDTIDVTVDGAAVGTGIPERAILKIGTCFERNVFSKTNASDTDGLEAASGGGNIDLTARPNGSNALALPFSTVWDEDTKVFADVMTIYYIGEGESGLPALYRMESECGFQIADCEEIGIEAVELVEGVENMQILYGVDSDDDGVVNQYFSADATTFDFNNVVSLRFSLLMRSDENSEDVDTNTYTLADKININPTNERILRYVTSSTIELRNRTELLNLEVDVVQNN